MVIRESQFDFVLFQGDLVKVTRVGASTINRETRTFSTNIGRKKFIHK